VRPTDWIDAERRLSGTDEITVGQFLERWLEAHRSQVAPRTFERYAQIVRTGIVPLLGAAILTKLSSQQIAGAYSKALLSGRRDGAGGLSAQTVVHMHRVLRQALQQAFEWDLLARNPADKVKPPKIGMKSMNVLDHARTAALLAHFRPTRAFIPVLLAALCGFRRGEVVALKWKHVDFASASLSVCESLA